MKPASKHVGFYLLPVANDAALRDSLSPSLRKRLTGKSVFTFAAIDEALMSELERVVARAYEAYAGD